MYTLSVLTTAEHIPLEIPLRPQPQYLVSVDPTNKPALDIAHTFWSMLPGTVRVLPRGMVYFSGLAPMHLERFSGVVAIDDRRPVKTFYVGPEPFPEVLTDDAGNRTVVPVDPKIIIVQSQSKALDLVAEERMQALRDKHKAEEDALKAKLCYYGVVVLIFGTAAWLVWLLARGGR